MSTVSWLLKNMYDYVTLITGMVSQWEQILRKTKRGFVAGD